MVYMLILEPKLEQVCRKIRDEVESLTIVIEVLQLTLEEANNK